MGDPSSRRVALALPVALLAVALAVWALLSRPAPLPAPATTPCDCEGEAFNARIAALTTRLATAEAALHALVTARKDAPAAAEPVARAPAPDAPTASPRKPPRVARFESGHAGVEVSQNENGSLRVTNTDPALTGRTLLVETTLEDGSTGQIPVTVPPPE